MIKKYKFNSFEKIKNYDNYFNNQLSVLPELYNSTSNNLLFS